MNKIINSSFNVLIRPFSENLPFLLILCILGGSADLIFWAKEGNLIFGMYMALHAFIMCYAITFIIGIFDRKTQVFLKIFFSILGILNLIIDAGVHSIMGFGFTNDMVAIMMGTNIQESTEFCKLYINPSMIICVIAMLFLVIIVYATRKKIQFIPRWISAILFSVTLLSGIFIFARQSQNWGGVFLNKFVAFAKYKPAVNLSEYSKEYNVTQNGEMPDNIILIIGESLTKSHMAIYGYEKETTPKFKTNQNIIPFDQVTSPKTNTIESFKRFMALSNEGRSDCNWYEMPNLIDIIKSAEYTISWISNQSSSGVHDNLVARFAELSDNVIWCGQQYTGLGKKDYDEILLPEIEKDHAAYPHKHFTIVHLMGNHGDWNLRFPLEYKIFSASDYIKFPENQRQLRADYDNSVIYNDTIVDNIYSIFNDSEAIAIYLSDHAIDIFNSSADYIGHAKTNDPVSIKAGKDIPFIIYTTSSFREKYPEKISQFNSSMHNEFCTDKLIYSIMDIANISFTDEELLSSSQHVFTK